MIKETLIGLIGEFCSELSLEILATTDFVLKEFPNYTLDQIMKSIGEWSGRKGRLFKKEHVEIAFNHLHTRKNYILNY